MSQIIHNNVVATSGNFASLLASVTDAAQTFNAFPLTSSDNLTSTFKFRNIGTDHSHLFVMVSYVDPGSVTVTFDIDGTSETVSA